MSAAMLAEGLAQMGVCHSPSSCAGGGSPGQHSKRKSDKPDRSASRTSCAVQSSPWNLARHRHGVLHTSPATRGRTKRGGSSRGSSISRGKLHGGTGASIDPGARNLQGPPLSREAAASISQVIVTLTLQHRIDQRLHGIQLRRHEKPHDRIRADPASRMLDVTAGTCDSEAQGRESRMDAGRGPVSCHPL
jgi:hypothetical protein